MMRNQTTPNVVEHNCIMLYNDLCNIPSQSEIMNTCILERLEAVYAINDEYIDETLDKLESELTFNLTNPEVLAPIKHSVNALNHVLSLTHTNLISCVKQLI